MAVRYIEEDTVVKLRLQAGTARCKTIFHIINADVEPILGMGTIRKMAMVWNFGHDTITLGGQPFPEDETETQATEHPSVPSNDARKDTILNAKNLRPRV